IGNFLACYLLVCEVLIIVLLYHMFQFNDNDLRKGLRRDYSAPSDGHPTQTILRDSGPVPMSHPYVPPSIIRFRLPIKLYPPRKSCPDALQPERLLIMTLSTVLPVKVLPLLTKGHTGVLQQKADMQLRWQTVQDED